MSIESYDRIMANSIEDGDHIAVMVDGEEHHIEVSSVGEDPEAPVEGIRVTGYSHETGDLVTADLYFADYVDLWTV
jgi:hypothetical protein